jgi:hypothetical protein
LAIKPRRLPELSVKKTDKLRAFLDFQLQVTSSYFKLLQVLGHCSKTSDQNHPKLSWKSTTCDAWPAFLIDLNRIAGGFCNRAFRR